MKYLCVILLINLTRLKMNNLLNVLLMMPQGEGSNPLAQILPLVLIIAVFYMFMIRPQMKKQKDLKTYRDSLNKGDKIVTTGGIYGKIADIKDQVVLVEIADKIRIKIDKSAVLKDSSDIGKQK